MTAAAVLGTVHALVGDSNGGGQRGWTFGRGSSDADVDRPASIEVVVSVEIFQEATHDFVAFGEIRCGKKHAELIAAETSDEIVGPESTTQNRRESLEMAIAGGMTLFVVDLFEIVNVDHDGADRRLTSSLEFGFAFLEERSIVQVGQCVVSREIAQVIFLAHALVDVPNDRDRTTLPFDFTLIQGDLQKDGRAVLANPAQSPAFAHEACARMRLKVFTLAAVPFTEALRNEHFDTRSNELLG